MDELVLTPSLAPVIIPDAAAVWNDAFTFGLIMLGVGIVSGIMMGIGIQKWRYKAWLDELNPSQD